MGIRSAAATAAAVVLLIGCAGDQPTTPDGERAAERATTPTESGSVDLPPPDPDAKTTVQFRGVLRLAESGCTGPGENPRADAPAKLVADEDTCYELAPAGVEVERVKSARARRDPEGRLYLDVEVSSRDAAAFDRLASAYFGKNIAIVAFGRVLSAPSVQQREFGGSLHIQPVTPQQASDLLAALTA